MQYDQILPVREVFSGYDELLNLDEVWRLPHVEEHMFNACVHLPDHVGPWLNFFQPLVQRAFFVGGTDWGMTWAWRYKIISFKTCTRYARWVEVRNGDEIFVAAFVPTEYRSNGVPYLDYEFVVASNSENFPLTVLLYQEQILTNT